MPRKGLTKELVIDAAFLLIEEKGPHSFSINELARRLDIKPASIYNHVKNMEELLDEVGARIAAMLRDAEMEAIAGKSRDEAFFALSAAYRTFASEHTHLYKMNAGRQLTGKDFEKAKKGEIVDPLLKVISDYDVEEAERMEWHWTWRAMMHGCITQEYIRRVSHVSVDFDRVYQRAMETILLGICDAETKKAERDQKS